MRRHILRTSLITPPDPSQKLFSVDEANKLLPVIAPLVEQLQGLHASTLKANDELNAVVAKLSAGNGYPLKELQTQAAQLAQHQLHLVEAFQSACRQLEELGAVLKDLSQGLVDFYAIRDGDLVFLCWRLGEDKIRYWHTLDSGFSARQPLP